MSEKHKGLLKKIVVERDCIFFLSHADDMWMEILEPIPIPRLVKLTRKYSKANPYVDTGSFVAFLEKSIKAVPCLEKEVKENS